jgi:hypothetical protein
VQIIADHRHLGIDQLPWDTACHAFSGLIAAVGCFNDHEKSVRVFRPTNTIRPSSVTPTVLPSDWTGMVREFLLSRGLVFGKFQFRLT